MAKKSLLFASVIAAALVAPLMVSAAPFQAALTPVAGSALHETRPLVVIRFNQRNVYYQRPLYSAVVRALQVKPTVKFEVVSMIPVTGDADTDEKNAKISMNNVQRVFQDMVDMGIPDKRINVSREDSSTVATNEVHVFVR